MEINRTTVKIAGREYTLSGKESEAYIHRVATYVDRKICELERRYANLSSSEIAVLAAINVADELFKLREEMPEARALGEKSPAKSVPAPQPAVGPKHFFSKSK